MRILVTGATGNIGRMVVDHLVEAGGCTVRALTVDPPRADLPAGVEVAVGSVRRPETLPAPSTASTPCTWRPPRRPSMR